ncbi:MAG TPA: DUF1501 domain-containing protein [Bryobacteraceae bacterium]|nr:DUF1501 domain-containing protein [Bryobacteraceae bacterium]
MSIERSYVPMHVRYTPVHRLLSRRDFFGRIGSGLGGIALGSLLAETDAPYNVAPKRPHFAPKARRVIMLFQNGGPSQVDMFDPKTELVRRQGQKPGDGYVNPVDVQKTGTWLASPFRFHRDAQCGMELSELIPETAKHAGEMALIRSMVTTNSNHEQAIWNFNTGLVQPGRPSMGSWVVHGLGSENQSLPAYVAILHPDGMPVDGIRNFSSGWMPQVYHGMPMRAEGSPVINLEPRGHAGAARDRLELLQKLNREHLRGHPGQAELEARIASFELAARMQLEATSVLDLSKESAETRALYGTETPETAVHGRQCLLARRLVENGVRYVQVLHQGQPWDTHKENEKGHRKIAARTDRPAAALLTDLKRRGMLEDTLVIWAGEFGRTPMGEGKDGRDHHKDAFSLWMAGGGIKGGVVYGKTDDFGYSAVENPVTIADFHATVLHLLGLDYRSLVYKHGTREERLTDVHQPRVIRDILT